MLCGLDGFTSFSFGNIVQIVCVRACVWMMMRNPERLTQVAGVCVCVCVCARAHACVIASIPAAVFLIKYL